MPIYEYKCASCGKVFEALQKFTDEALVECRFCQGPVSDLISSSSFQLKGSGWYVTDYARKSTGDKSSSESEAPKSDGGDKAGTSSDKAETPAKPAPASPRAERARRARTPENLSRKSALNHRGAFVAASDSRTRAPL